MADGGALHRPLHRPGPASRAHVETAESELVTHLLGVVVLDPANGVSAPAHDQVWAGLKLQYPRIAQNVKHGIGDARGGPQVEAPAFHDLVRDENDVPQHSEQVILQAADHLTVDEGSRRGVLDLELDSPGAAHDPQIEVLVFLENG